MTNEIIKYETGATSHAVNDLILFTDNTRSLAELRDLIYKQWVEWDNSNPSGIADAANKSNNKSYFTKKFKEILWQVIRSYNNEFGETYSYYDLQTKQINEYARLYVIDFPNWKKENKIV